MKRLTMAACIAAAVCSLAAAEGFRDLKKAADALKGEKKWAEAARAYEQARAAAKSGSYDEVNALNMIGYMQAKLKNFDAAAKAYLAAQSIDPVKYHPWGSQYLNTVGDMIKAKDYANAVTLADALLNGGNRDTNAVVRAAGLWGEAIAKSRPSAEARRLILAQMEKGAGVRGLLDGYHLTFPPREGNVARFAETFKLFDRHEKRIAPKDKISFWEQYSRKAWGSCAYPAMKRAMTELAALGEDPFKGYHRAKIMRSIEAFEEIASFPKKESEIRFPDSLADFGVQITNTVDIAQDFGFDPVNATEFVQKAIDSGANRIVFSNVGKPWFIRKIRIVRNDLEIVFKKGVRVHTDRTWEKFAEGQMFVIKGKNIVIKGENDNDTDVVVSQFYNLADRSKNCRTYGKSAFMLIDSENVCIKNLRAAETAEDGLVMGGLGLSNKNIYVENVDFDSNFRQGCSICAGHGVYFKNVKFRRTAGAEPLSGVDLEPAELNESNSGIYFFDCTFEDNMGYGLLFSTSCCEPITVYAKRCVFRGNNNAALGIAIRTGIYNENGIKTPGKAVFEDCEFYGWSDVAPVKIEGALLLDTTFKNCSITDTGVLSSRSAKPDASAVQFVLNRDNDNSSPGKTLPQAIVTFENVTIAGYTNAPPVAFRDQVGRYSVRGLKGSFDFNGKKTNAADFAHVGPEGLLTEIPATVPTGFRAPARVAPLAAREHPFTFRYAGTGWWTPPPDYTYLFYGKAGDTAEMTLRYAGDVKEKDRAIVVTTPSGRAMNLGAFAKGDNTVEITFAETGWHAFRPAPRHTIVSYRGIDLNYYSGTGKDRRAQIEPSAAGYVGYFEVPAKEEITLKVQQGELLIRDAKGEKAGTCAATARSGNGYMRLKSASGKPEVWSFTITSTATFKFFAPAVGVWADAPDALATRAADVVRSPVVTIEKAEDAADGAAAEIVQGVPMAEFLKTYPVLAKIVAREADERLAWAKKGDYTKLHKEKVAWLDMMKNKPDINDQQMREVSDEARNVPRLEQLAKTEAWLRTIDRAELERYAFLNLFVVFYGVYPEIDVGQDFIRAHAAGAVLAEKYPRVHWWIYKTGYEDYIRDVVGGFNLSYRDFTLTCDDGRKLDKLLPMVEKFVSACMPPELK